MPSAASTRSLLVRGQDKSQTGSCLQSLSLSLFLPSSLARPCSSKLSFSGHRRPTCSYISCGHLLGGLLMAVPCHSGLAYSMEGGTRSVAPALAVALSLGLRANLPSDPASHLIQLSSLLCPGLSRMQEGTDLSRDMGRVHLPPFSLYRDRH